MSLELGHMWTESQLRTGSTSWLQCCKTKRHLIILWLSNHPLPLVLTEREKKRHIANNSLTGWAGKHLVWHHRWEFGLKLFDWKCYLKASERHRCLVIMCFEWSLRMKRWNSKAIFLRGQTGRRSSWGCRREDEEAAVQQRRIDCDLLHVVDTIHKYRRHRKIWINPHRENDFTAVS